MTVQEIREPFVRATRRDWLSFAGQVTLVTGIELSDEIVRGMITQRDTAAGLLNAQRVVRFEAAHGFWVEPGWQQFFERTHHLLGLAISWAQVVPIVNSIYVLGHIGVTLLFALWVFFFRRGIFAFVRNIFFITNALALVLYETFPLAPPRLTSGLRFEGRPVAIADTLYGILGADGKVEGTKIGYNEFAAMPSIHVGWALIVGLTLAWALRPLPLRMLSLCYPLLMLAAVVISGNHYLLDALGSVAIVGLAAAGSLLLLRYRYRSESLGALLRRLQHLRHQAPVPGVAQGPQRLPHRAAA